MKEFALGNQTFAEIIDENLLYADKTKYVYDLVHSKKRNFFLSRPRRFGKTLLLETFYELFTGGRERFKDLWIGQSDYDFPKLPVIYLSLSVESNTAEILKKSILRVLAKIAESEELSIKDEMPNMYLSELVQALSKKRDSKVVILIDEYDAPVTRNMDNIEVAQANAKVLHDFFATLKQPFVSRSIRFTFVTSITRYAITSMDSGPNHLNDISLNPRYAGICGFTVDEFPTLFADRMKPTLKSLKSIGQIKASANVNDLCAEIKDWYDGYNWGGAVRVLNPFTVLNFFENAFFDNYWILSDRPGHLTALIKDNPAEYLEPQLEPTFSEEIRQSELTKLKALPVLFHSGYLTVDRIHPVLVKDLHTNKLKRVISYTFRFPNFEVSNSYRQDICEAIFGLKSGELITKGQEIREAILARDAVAIGTIFSNFFSALSYRQRPADEKNFRALIHMILLATGFKVKSELSGATTRIDCLVEVVDRIFVIIELKYSQNPTKISKAEKNAALVPLALEMFSVNLLDQKLALSSLSTKYTNAIIKVLYDNTDKVLTKEDKTHLIANTIRSLAQAKEVHAVLAKVVEKNVPAEEIEAILSKKVPDGPTLDSEQVDALLTESLEKALNDIIDRGYHKSIANEAKDIILKSRFFFLYKRFFSHTRG
jgi:hypothetical protein